MREKNLSVTYRSGLGENEKYFYGETRQIDETDRFEPHGDGVEFLWPSIFPKTDSEESLKNCFTFIRERPVYWG